VSQSLWAAVQARRRSMMASTTSIPALCSASSARPQSAPACAATHLPTASQARERVTLAGAPKLPYVPRAQHSRSAVPLRDPQAAAQSALGDKYGEWVPWFSVSVRGQGHPAGVSRAHSHAHHSRSCASESFSVAPLDTLSAVSLRDRAGRCGRAARGGHDRKPTSPDSTRAAATAQ
jgi:hypothetical protein